MTEHTGNSQGHHQQDDLERQRRTARNHAGQPAVYNHEGNMCIQMNAKLHTEIKPTTILTNQPINLDEQGLVFYFEVKILAMSPNKRNIIIGFCPGDQKRTQILGYKKGSYGFQATGRTLSNAKESSYGDLGEEFGQRFEEKDVIGCGLLISKREVFYTKNGALIGTAFRDVKIPENGLYPAICLQSTSHHIQANFGRVDSQQPSSSNGGSSSASTPQYGTPFMFDLDGFCQRECLENFFEICGTPFDQSKMHNLVKSYLVHYAYVETLQAYEDEEMECAHGGPTDPILDKPSDQAGTQKEGEIELAARMATSKPIAGRGNVFPGLTEVQMKQVQQKQALNSKNDQPGDDEDGAQVSKEAASLKMKQRKMTEDDKKVRFMINAMDEPDGQHKDLSPFKHRESLGAISQTVDDEDLSSNTAGSPGKARDSTQQEEISSPLPFSKLAGDEDALKEWQKGKTIKNMSIFDRKSSLMNAGSQLSTRKLQRSESLFDPPMVSDKVIKKNEKDFKPDSSVYLKERGMLKYKIQSGRIEEAREYLKQNFPQLFAQSIKIRSLLDSLQFIKYI